MLKFTVLFECEKDRMNGSKGGEKILLERFGGGFCGGLRGILSL